MHVEEKEEEEKEALTAKVLYWGSVSGSMKKEREQERAREAVWKNDRPHYQQSSDSDASAFVHIFVFVLVCVCVCVRTCSSLSAVCVVMPAKVHLHACGRACVSVPAGFPKRRMMGQSCLKVNSKHIIRQGDRAEQ